MASENHFEPIGWRHRHFSGKNGKAEYEKGQPYDANTEILQLTPKVAYSGLWLSRQDLTKGIRQAQIHEYYADLHRDTGIEFLLIQKKDGRPPLGGVKVEGLPDLYRVDLREF